MRRLLVNIGQLAHLDLAAVSGPLKGTQLSDEEGLLSRDDTSILITDDVISKITDSESMIEEYAPQWRGQAGVSITTYDEIEVWDVAGRAVIPGLIDAHSHLIWAGDRSQEVSMARRGMSYQQIAAAGGGIAKTVSATRMASSQFLYEEGLRRAAIALKMGTVHLESKSGYGLTKEDELKILDVSNQVDGSIPLQMSHTWLGAHACPRGTTHSEYVEQLITEQLPSVASQQIATSADVFCEPGWFTLEETERICTAALDEGMEIRLHVDEFQDGGGAQLAAGLGARTADHAAHSSEESLSACNDKGVMIGFLPGTPYTLGIDHWPPFATATENNWAWSLATDFNPNCHSLSLPFAASLAVHRCGVTPLAALVASSRNPATTLTATAHPSAGMITEGGPASLNILWGEEVDGWCLTPGINPFIGTICNGEIITSMNS